MAVYRSDQAQVTFGTETSPGAYAELATTVTGGTITAMLDGTHAAGVTQLLTSAADYNTISSVVQTGVNLIGKPVKIGGASGTHSEIRTVEHATATVLYLNAPTAFAHLDNAAVIDLTSVGTAANDQFITVLPGVYDTVDVPDPSMTIEPKFFLGTQAKRNYAIALKGQQSFAGSIGGMVMLNGRALRFPFGKLVTVPAASMVTAFSPALTCSGEAPKGSVFVKVTGSGTLAAIPQNTLVLFDGHASASNTRKSEVRKHVGAAISAGSGPFTLQLDYPLQYTHDTGAVVEKVTHVANTVYTHHIYETVDLDTVSWHVHMRDSGETAANDFDRRYYGGLIGSASLSADEGGMLSMSWDGVNFQGMVHNQKTHSSLAAGKTVPYYGVTQTITSGGSPSAIDFPTTEPYFFSQGSVSLFGQTIARIRSFNLSVSNGEEPRYYVQRRYGNQRGPNEIREGRREYSMSATLALPDSQIAYNGDGRTLFKELLLEGDYGAGMVGFDVELTFARGTVGTSAVSDEIRIYIPGTSTTGATASAAGLNSQGAIIRTAPHAITGDNPVQVDADILFRNMKIEIVDNLYYYP
jgi:hypothetical protein